MKAERVSYPVMTPSAARGVLEAIFWKPEFSWRVREVRVLKPIRHFSILRNEINEKVNIATVKARADHGTGYFSERDRAQRHTLGLLDVEYILKADLEVKPGVTEKEAKYRDQFRRNVSKGRCHHMPYLGCREFTAFFGEPGDEKPIDYSCDLGNMLFDLEYVSGKSGRGVPRFFNAKLEDGVMKVPAELYSPLLNSQYPTASAVSTLHLEGGG